MIQVKGGRTDFPSVQLYGKLDTTSAPETERAILTVAARARRLELDFSELQYLSSAGLRMLLVIRKKLSEHGGELQLTHVTPQILEILKITGFCELLTIVPDREAVAHAAN